MHLLPEQSRNSLKWQDTSNRSLCGQCVSACQKSCLISLDHFIWALHVSIKVKQKSVNVLVSAPTVVGWIKKKKEKKHED